MISSTLKQYTDSYNINLSNYLSEYEDNTKAFFLQSEKANYQAYQNALAKISNQIKMFSREELNNNLVNKSFAADLKTINNDAYNTIITELNQSKDSNVLSISSLKNYKIKIDQKLLENYIKSSVDILKFITEEYEKSINANVIEFSTEETSNDVQNLMIKTVELNLENLFLLGVTPDIISHSFEEWLISRKDFFVDFEDNLIYLGLDKYNNNLETTLSLLHKRLARNGMSEIEIENYSNDKRNEIKSNLDSTLLCFNDSNKPEFLLKSMQKASTQISRAKKWLIDGEISLLLKGNNLNYHLDLNEQQIESPKETNPYPRIFTTTKAFNKFKNLVEEFGKGNQDLANFSFVFHRMKKDNLIFKDLKQIEYIDFLSFFEINLDRLKPISQLGNNDLRESIYNRV
jgi:hypothetical protein